MEKNKIFFAWLTFAILIIVWIIVRPMGYIFLLTAPQYAIATNELTITAKNMSLNGQSIPMENFSWKIRMNEPKKLLSGASQIMLSHEGSPAYFAFSFCPKGADLHDLTLGIINDQVTLGIDISKNGKKYSSKWTRDAATWRCEGIIATKEAPSGEIILDEFKQSIKHLILKGHLQNISVKLVGEDENDAMTLTIDSLDFSINSPVTYEWSNKAGDTWRL